MEPVTIGELLEWTKGDLVAGNVDGKISDVSTDSRNGCAGMLFVPLKGDNFDGHDFIEAAVEKGAFAVMTEHKQDRSALRDDIVLIVVGDALKAFQDIAANYRKKYKTTIVGITGSNGKTTTKEFVKAIAVSEFITVATKGTRNNHIGVPQSLLTINSETEVGIIEMGMSAAGEMRNLAQIVAPNIGVILNVAPVHTEFFESVENVARAKSELLEELDENALAVLNADDDWFEFFRERAKCRIISFGKCASADVRSGPVRSTAEGIVFDVEAGGSKAECSLKAFGKHNASNAIAAIAVGMELGVGISKACNALSYAKPPEMRFQVERIGNITVINDAYNANPVSTIAALDTLEESYSSGRRIAVLGDMLELGWYSVEGHREVGKRIARSHVEVLVAVGGLAEGIADSALAEGFEGEILKAESSDEASVALKGVLRNGDILLVKGSRGLRLERIIKLLRNDNLK